MMQSCDFCRGSQMKPVAVLLLAFIVLAQSAAAQEEKTDDPAPNLALSYFRRIYDGGVPDLDFGSPRNAALLLVSADVKGFHYDANAMLNEVIDGTTHRAQFGQSLTISHLASSKLTISGEIWHFTQPFLRANAVGSLWALSYAARSNLVFDGGFNHGLTDSSTRWEVFVGFTYLLPR